MQVTSCISYCYSWCYLGVTNQACQSDMLQIPFLSICCLCKSAFRIQTQYVCYLRPIIKNWSTAAEWSKKNICCVWFCQLSPQKFKRSWSLFCNFSKFHTKFIENSRRQKGNNLPHLQQSRHIPRQITSQEITQFDSILKICPSVESHLSSYPITLRNLTLSKCQFNPLISQHWEEVLILSHLFRKQEILLPTL